jgi:TolB protein
MNEERGTRRRARQGWRLTTPAVSQRLTLALTLALTLLSAPRLTSAQDTTFREGVRIGLRYDPGLRPGVIVLPIAGPAGDSAVAILQRDLDYGDRVTMITGDGIRAASAAIGAGGTGSGTAGTPNYKLIASLGAAAVVRATITGSALHVALHDISARRIVQVHDFVLAGAPLSAEWRLEVHAASDEIERWITGTRGIAATRVLFVRDGQVWLTDSDGSGARPVSDRGLSLSPAWHPGGRQIAYSAFGDRGTQIVVRDLASGSARWLSATPGGLNVTPVFSPDGNTLVYAHGEDEGTDLVATPALESGAGRRITVGRGSDNVSPSFSPDGRRLAYTSGRSGHPEIYITDVDGTNADLLTPYAFGDQYYRSNPDWSPDGRVIAFQSQLNGVFQVMTINLRDRGIRQLTSEGRNEDPSWAPDGRHLVFTSTRTGTKQLFVLDVESGRSRQLTTGRAARLAAWSPDLARTLH